METQEIKYVPNTYEVLGISPKYIVGKTVGNFSITGLAGDGRVKATCLLCGNKDYETQWHKIKTGHTTSCGCKQKMVNVEQHIGKKINMLTIIGISDLKDKTFQTYCNVKCDCGNTKVLSLASVLRGKYKSCGCISRRNISQATFNIPDKEKYQRIMDIWRQMMKRCYQSGSANFTEPELQFLNKDTPHNRYDDYGKRGITVDKKWWDRNEFYSWYVTNIKPGESNDRINNDGPYSPLNCRSGSVVTQIANQRLRKDNRMLYKGIIFTGYSYGYTLGINGDKFKKEGFKTPEQALIERNIHIATNKLEQVIQPIVNKSVRSFFNMVTDRYHIAYAIDDNAIVMSRTNFKTRDDNIMQEVIAAMNNIYSTL